ncbi:MAG: hypothetical protein ACLGQW_05320, partial [Acidobacteriota bacterium]
MPFLFCLLLFIPSIAQARGWSTSVDSNGVKWLLTPERAQFFSLGVNTIHPGSNDEKAQANQAYYFAHTYPDKKSWAEAAQSRLTAWGFNTAGGWSDP